VAQSDLVDTPPPSAVDPASLTAILTRTWSIELDRLRYVPKGAGSYHWLGERNGRATHFVTVDDLDTKPWIGRDRDSTFAGLTVAYETAWVLHHEDGVDAVVAPVRGDNGAVTARIGEQFSVALFPYVDGEAGSWGDAISPGRRVRLLHELARLHRAARAQRAGIHWRPHELPERAALLEALADLDRSWHGGEFSEPARQALSENAWRVRERLARFDDLAAQLDRSSGDLVVTHGEPHPGNLIHIRNGLRIIDWDTVALAEHERDLWMLGTREDGALEAYSGVSGMSINRAAIDFYRLAWTLSDIASFARMFRGEHASTRWTEHKWRGFVDLLKGASSDPYATT
jgi:spectinomycin phosphotransferase